MIGQKIRNLRLSKKLTLEELADKLNSSYPGTVSFNKGKLSKWENEKEEPKLSSMRILADFYRISIDDFYSSSTPKPTTLTLINDTSKQLNDDRQENVLEFAKEQLEEQNNNIVDFPTGRETAAGSPLDGDVQDGNCSFVKLDSTIVPRGADELITIAGNSMEPTYEDGSQVFIHYQPSVEQGEIAVVNIQDTGVTCKKIYYDWEEGDIILHSINDKYDDMIYPMNQVRIIGKVL